MRRPDRYSRLDLGREIAHEHRRARREEQGTEPAGRPLRREHPACERPRARIAGSPRRCESAEDGMRAQHREQLSGHVGGEAREPGPPRGGPTCCAFRAARTRPSARLGCRSQRADDLRLLASHHVGRGPALGDPRDDAQAACPAPARASRELLRRPPAGRRMAPRPSPARCRSSPTRSRGVGPCALDQSAVIAVERRPEVPLRQLEDPPRLGAPVEIRPLLAEADRRAATRCPNPAPRGSRSGGMQK